MELGIYIFKVLQKYSSKEVTRETHPMTRQEIRKKLVEEYKDESISDKKVRIALDYMINMESYKDDKDKIICYRTYGKEDSERHTDYYYNNSISDVELKFLIDSVMYSKIFNTPNAQNLAKRLQDLSGKQLVDITSYANDSFGKQRYTLSTNVLDNIKAILQSIKDNKWISFKWNVYGVENGKVSLINKDTRRAKPIKIILNDGRYYLFARHINSEKVYTYSVDLMTNINLVDVEDDDISTEVIEKNFRRAKYILQHPFMMGGKTQKYTLKVSKEYFSRLVDTFAYEIEIDKSTETNKTVEVKVTASRDGILQWLLQHNYMATLVKEKNSDKELEKMLSDAVNKLYNDYHI